VYNSRCTIFRTNGHGKCYAYKNTVTLNRPAAGCKPLRRSRKLLEKFGCSFKKRFETDSSGKNGRARRIVVQGHRGLRCVLQVIPSYYYLHNN